MLKPCRTCEQPVTGISFRYDLAVSSLPPRATHLLGELKCKLLSNSIGRTSHERPRGLGRIILAWAESSKRDAAQDVAVSENAYQSVERLKEREEADSSKQSSRERQRGKKVLQRTDDGERHSEEGGEGGPSSVRGGLGV